VFLLKSFVCFGGLFFFILALFIFVILGLENLVILNPEWLAQVMSSVVSFKGFVLTFLFDFFCFFFF
jgi:hypothetical protein